MLYQAGFLTYPGCLCLPNLKDQWQVAKTTALKCLNHAI